MSLKPLCLVDPWCSEWGCCECDFDKEDFKEPPKKAKGKGGKESNRVKAVCFTNINGQDL